MKYLLSIILIIVLASCKSPKVLVKEHGSGNQMFGDTTKFVIVATSKAN